MLQKIEFDLDFPDGLSLRYDRVGFCLGGIAYTHVLQGLRMRCLLEGQLTVATEGHSTTIVPGNAWIELGPYPVLAAAWSDSPTGFVRVMVLFRSLKGKNSLPYVNSEDRQEPEPQQYQIFVDEFIDH